MDFLWIYNTAIIPKETLADQLETLRLQPHDAWFARPCLWRFAGAGEQDDGGQLQRDVKWQKLLFLAALHQTAFGERPPPAAIGSDEEKAAARAIVSGASLDEAFFDRRWSLTNLGTRSVEAPELAVARASLAAIEPALEPPDDAPSAPGPDPTPGPSVAERWQRLIDEHDERRERVHAFCRWAIEQLCRRYEQTSCFLLPTPCLDIGRLEADLSLDGITLRQNSPLRARLPAEQDLELELHFALREPRSLRPPHTRKLLEGTAALDAEWEPGKPMRGSVEEVVRKVDRLEGIPLLDF